MGSKPQTPLILLLLSSDSPLVNLVRKSSNPRWQVEQHHNIRDGEPFARPNIRLVVVDDAVVENGDRGWLLAQVRSRTSGIPLMYVAKSHDIENERRARASGALYYTSKPLDESRFVQVLRSFMKTQE